MPANRGSMWQAGRLAPARPSLSQVGDVEMTGKSKTPIDPKGSDLQQPRQQAPDEGALGDAESFANIEPGEGSSFANINPDSE